MKTEKEVLIRYLRDKGKLVSRQRELILEVFLKTEEHPTINDLYDLVRKKRPQIGLATVYRAMEVICDAGLGRKVDFGDGTNRYEHEYKHLHHHHLVCLECGKIIEVSSDKLEAIQKQLAKKHGFTIAKDIMQIFGLCRACRRKVKPGR